MVLYRIILLAFFCWGSASLLKAQTIAAEKVAGGSGYRFSLTPKPQPPLKPVGGTTAPKWLYFWEFGDGHYSEEEFPVHTFSRAGDFEVKVYLTPAYSLDRGKKFVQTIAITQTGATRSEKMYPVLTPQAAIRLTSNNNELVMREELQLVIHYLPPPGYTSGKIVLAFNEKLSARKSFRYIGSRLYSGEKEIADVFSDPGVKGNAGYLSYLETQAADYQSVMAFSYEQKTPQTSRIFVTLGVESPRVGMEIGLKVFFIPDKGPLRPTGTYYTKTMMILASHDPNRITVIPRTIEFPVPVDTAFKYRVFFQNKGEGDANGIRVRVNIDPTLNSDSLVVLDARIANELCPMCNDTMSDRASCLEVEKQEKYLDFVFKNVRLAGTKGAETQDNQTTKGEITFRMKPRLVNSEKGAKVADVDAVFTRAAIKFDTEEDTIFTNQIDTQFRLRTIGVKAGYNLGRPLSELVSSASGLSNVFVAVSFSDNPVHKGQAWESEVAYSGYRFTRDKSQIYINENDLLNRDSIQTKLALNLYYLDILAQSRFHFNDYVGVGFGGGFSTLIAGVGQYEATLEDEQSVQTVGQEVRTGLAFLGREYEELVFPLGEKFDPDIQNNPGAFLAMNLFAELGLGKVNRGPMAGFRYGSRFQNGLFDFSFSRQNFMQVFFQWKF
ncbi:MAG: PKD domain-containing protein [Bacteroidia bacterium]|nr:PKD domain-containing protein [Bacteroidia bacterium]